ncbi:MAG TPA: PAS domain S-box protein [Allosphingosinicella sp.]|jgi:PAS domain S-box-containing protein
MSPSESESALDLEDFFENGTVGLHLVGPDGTILKANRADYEPLGYTADEYVGRSITEFHADGPVIEDILGRLTRGEKLDKYRARLRARDGSLREVEISSSVCFREGEFVNTRCFTVDVTAKVQAEEALREAKERLAATYESVLAGIAEVDAEGHFLRVNEAFCTITGYSREELLAKDIADITHPEDREREAAKLAAQVKGEVDHYETEKRYVRADGGVICVAVTSSTVRDSTGAFAYGVRMVQDITERVEGDRQKKLLLNELNHRVKNTLSTVQALVTQTARSCTTAAEFRSRFEPRLLALSTAHDRLTRNEWLGVRLAEIVEEELSVHRTEDRSLTADGPPLVLPPKISLSLSLALHELATNAAKYGSLSGPGGAVTVSWEVEDAGDRTPLLRLRWIESGGPLVVPPQSSGFGTRLLKVTAAELGGEMNADYLPSGLRWDLRFALKGV